jgi:hypothetical protein
MVQLLKHAKCGQISILKFISRPENRPCVKFEPGNRVDFRIEILDIEQPGKTESYKFKALSRSLIEKKTARATCRPGLSGIWPGHQVLARSGP